MCYNSFGLVNKDLYSLYSRQDTDNAPKEEEEQEKINEQTNQEPSRKEKTDVMKTVHSKIKKLLIPIINQLTSDDSSPIPFKKMSVAVTSAIKELNKVLSFFPSIKYSDNLFSSYRDSIRELDFIFTNIQDPSITSKSIAVRTMLDKLQDFSSKVEELFDVPSKISNISSDKPKPKPDEQEPDEQEPQTLDQEPEDSEKPPAPPNIEPEEKPEGISNITSIQQKIKPSIFAAFARAFDFDTNVSGEAELRLKRYFNSFIKLKFK